LRKFVSKPSSTSDHIHFPVCENKNVAKRGGNVAGNARKNAEKELGRSVVSKKNYLGKDDKKELEQ